MPRPCVFCKGGYDAADRMGLVLTAVQRLVLARKGARSENSIPNADFLESYASLVPTLAK